METDKKQYLFYQTRKQLPFIAKSRGVYMWDDAGREYIDACSGAMVSNIGHGHPRILRAVQRQAQKTFFAYRTQFENESAVELAAGIVSRSAPHLERIFYVGSGSEAVETAMKLCRQYYYAKGQGSRYLFVSREPSYHGCTLGALALTSYAPLEAPFRPLMQNYPKIPAPYCYRCALALTYPACGVQCARMLEDVIRRQGPENVAAFVAEPVGGASTGALVPPEEYFGIVQAICRRYDIMLILDEVMTGMGRTGKMFAYEHWGVEADIVALAKGMAAGYYPLGAVVTRKQIVDEVVGKGGFMHGFTYAGNPMACAVGLEVFDIIVENDLPANAAAVGAHLKAGLEHLAERHPIIGQVRGRGLLLAIELVRDPDTREPFAADRQIGLQLTDTAFSAGLIIYPRRPIHGLAGDHVLIAPPLAVTAAEADEILNRLEQALGQVESTAGNG
ncbi:MAG: aspartate aminotransferase family protein [Desulfobacterales bacterium]